MTRNVAMAGVGAFAIAFGAYCLFLIKNQGGKMFATIFGGLGAITLYLALCEWRFWVNIILFIAFGIMIGLWVAGISFRQEDKTNPPEPLL